MNAWIKRAVGERGATAVEYAIIGSLIAAVIVLAVNAVGVNTAANFQDIVDAFPV